MTPAQRTIITAVRHSLINKAGWARDTASCLRRGDLPMEFMKDPEHWDKHQKSFEYLIEALNKVLGDK